MIPLSMNINDINIDNETKKAVLPLLSKVKNGRIKVEDIWRMVDDAWDELRCDNRNLDWNQIDKFYRHPVWLVNGLFIEQDDVSMQHRHAISGWIVRNNFKRVLDYGGGFGILARLIADKDAAIKVDVYEPYPTEFAIAKAANYSNISFVSSLEKDYDCIISYTVLEHVIDPLKLFSQMVESLRKDGYMIVANDFSPVVKCHIPFNFHLRYTFNIIAQLMGLKLIGPCKNSPATIFQNEKIIYFNWPRIRFYENVSRILFPFFKIVHFAFSRLRKGFIKLKGN